MVKIQLFGGLDVSAPGDGRICPSNRSCRILVAYLALRPDRGIPRDRLAGVLWPDRTDRAAQKALRNALWRIGRARPGGPPLVSVDRDRVGLATGGAADGAHRQPALWIDVQEFEGALSDLSPGTSAPLSADRAARLEWAVGLYRGDLLEGLDEDWVSGPRESLRLLHQNALERLLLHHRASGDLRRAIVCGRELLRRNPFLEHVHRELMLCHWAVGDRPMAVRQYRSCERVLRSELDLEPMAETRELLERIRAGSPRSRSERDDRLGLAL